MDPSESELQERRVRLAKGESPAAIAADYGRKPGTVYAQASRERDLIASIRDGLLDVVDEQSALTDGLHWVNDIVRSLQVFETDSDRLRELSYDPELQPKDVERYLKTATQIATRAHDLAGMLKSRVQAQVQHVDLVEHIGGFDEPGLVHHRPEPESEPRTMPPTAELFCELPDRAKS
jgi:hypothetical protein